MIKNIDFFNEAFGGFDANEDDDAALKLSLDSIFRDGYFEELARLISQSSKLASFLGEPGWELERRLHSGFDGYETWPNAASFCASVDVDSYELAYPEFYCDRSTFMEYLRRIIGIFRKYNGDECLDELINLQVAAGVDLGVRGSHQ